MDTECSWSSNSWMFGVEKCQNAATRTVIFGCVHEHIAESPTCDDCIDSVRRTIDAGQGLCTPCRTGGTDGVRVVLISDEPLVAVTR